VQDEFGQSIRVKQDDKFLIGLFEGYRDYSFSHYEQQLDIWQLRLSGDTIWRQIREYHDG
jgi:hypothetical protein